MKLKKEVPRQGSPSEIPVEPPATISVSGPTEELGVAPSARAARAANPERGEGAESVELAPMFAAGERISGRYRVTRLLGAGGMGEVYAAEDLELRVEVALKTIRAEASESDRALERFKREIQLARKVTHPNVCRIFDLGLHLRAQPSGRLTPLSFLTMELLAGGTLAARLQAGRLDAAEALPLVEQMASALDAAHAAGVVHRDFKSGNVMLVPGGEGAARAVITDFGMARGTGRGDTRITGNGGFVGTPGYMAPEQVEGGEITPATDVYAFGVVVYEMVTGELPFAGETPLQTAVKRLSQPPRSPRALLPELDARWEAAILRALARDPAERFPSAGAFARALRGEADDARAGRLGRIGLIVGVLAIVVALIADFSYRGFLRSHRPVPGDPAAVAANTATAVPTSRPASSSSRPRRAVAVLGFKNLSGRPQTQWLSTALAEMLGMELAAGEQLRTIPGEKIERARQSLKLGEQSSLAPDTLARIARALGADYVIVGSYLSVGEGASATLRLDVRLEDARAGETALALTEQGTEKALFELVSSAGLRLRERLGAGSVSAADTGALRAALPSTGESARLYAEGLEKLRHFDARAARNLLEQAAKLDPRNALIRAELAQAESELGFDREARAESERAFDLSRNLSREERLLVEGRYLEQHQQWDKALGLYQALCRFFPDNLDYGVRLGWTEVLGGSGGDARLTVAALRKLPHSPDDEVLLDLIEAAAAEKLSDFKGELDAAQRAAAHSIALGTTIELGRARRDEAWAYIQLGQPERAVAASEESRRIFADANNPWGIAQALNMAGNAEQARGRTDAAEKQWRKSLEVARAAGDQDGEATALSNLAALYSDRGQLDRAQAMFDQVIVLSRRTGDDSGLAFTLADVANLYGRRNNYAEEARVAEQSVELFRKIGNEPEEAAVMGELAATRQAQGDLAGARALRQKALVIFEKAGAKPLEAVQHSGLARIALVAGDLEGARREFGLSLALRQAIGDQAKLASTRLALAEVDLEEGRFDAAEAPLRAAAAKAQRDKDRDAESESRIELARVELGRKRVAVAASEIARALELVSKNDDARPRLDAAIVAGQIHLAAGDHMRAVRELDAAAEEATRLGLLPRALEARLVRAEVELAAGDPSTARRHLAEIEREASAHGLGLVARKAAAARP